MKIVFLKKLLPIGLLIGLLSSCQKEDKYTYDIGNLNMEVKTTVEPAFFGDSISFTVHASDSEVPLSTLKVALYYTEEKVSEAVIRTKENGDYTAKIFVPFYKNVANGKATLKFALQNISKKIVTKEYDLPLSRPDFPFLLLESAGTTYRLNRIALNQYEAFEAFPSNLNAIIKAPKYGAHGNELTFGWTNGAIELGSKVEIPFSSTAAGKYKVNFNTLTFVGSPFVVPAINKVAMKRIDSDHYTVDLNLAKGEEMTFTDIENIANWWMDPDFFTQVNGKTTFNALSGKYRITADFKNKYFAVEAMTGNELAKLTANGGGAIWIIGSGIGKPSVSANEVGWNPSKALCMAPIGNKKYQITLVGNKTIAVNSIDFKFFHQKDWGGEFKGNQISTTSDLILINSESGNLSIAPGKKLVDGKTYKLTIDLSAGNDKAILTVE